MKQSELVFSFILIPVDYIMLVIAGLVVYFLRYESFIAQLRPPIFEIGLGEYIQIVLLVSIIWMPIFAFAGMYAIRRPRRLVDDFTRVILGCSTGLVAIVFFIFFRHELFGSRFIVLFGWLGAIVFVFLGRIIVRSVQRSMYKKSIGVLRVVVFGEDANTYHLVQSLKEDKAAGYVIIRHFKNLDDASRGSLINIVKNRQADMVIYAAPNQRRENLANLLRFCHENHLDFSYAADVLEATTNNVEITNLGGTPIVQIKRTPLDGWGRIVKRTLDFFGSAILIILFSPIMIITAIAIKLDSKGPVFFSRIDDGSLAKRIGQQGKPFYYFKFRSMVPLSHSKRYNELSDLDTRKGPLVKIKDDPRVTRVGKFIRKLSIDELPELILVLIGKMSLVGPRPHLPEEVGKYETHYKRLLNIKPGITGMAQISGRSNLSFNEEASLDLFYIENWSFWMDIKILIRTPWIVIKGKNAV
jgi:exopolysaccharide biosynthesis polyprenyl glycosylphosphotransferase